jgi:hypothetical protein
MARRDRKRSSSLRLCDVTDLLEDHSLDDWHDPEGDGGWTFCGCGKKIRSYREHAYHVANLLKDADLLRRAIT